MTPSDDRRPSAIVKHSIKLHGRMTSVTLEDAFWSGLNKIAAMRNTSVARLVNDIDDARHHMNLSSAIRLFVFEQLRDKSRTESAGNAGGSVQPNGPTTTD